MRRGEPKVEKPVKKTKRGQRKMQTVNWKKMLLFASIASVTPSLQNWATAVQSGQDIPFTAGNILVPMIPQAIALFAALFTNPWRKV